MASQLIQQTPKRTLSVSKDGQASLDQDLKSIESPIKQDPVRKGICLNGSQILTKEGQIQPNKLVSIGNSEIFRSRMPVKKLNQQQLLAKMLSEACSNRLISENRLCVQGYGKSSLAEKVTGQQQKQQKPEDNLSRSFYVEVRSKPKRMINTPETIMERARSCNSSSRQSRSNAMEALSLTKQKQDTNRYVDSFKGRHQQDISKEEEERKGEKQDLRLNLDIKEHTRLNSQENMFNFLTADDPNSIQRIVQEQDRIADVSGQDIDNKQNMLQNISKQEKLIQPKCYLWQKQSQIPFVGKNQQFRKSRPQTSMNFEFSQKYHNSQRYSNITQSLVSSPLKCVNFAESLIAASNSQRDSCERKLQIKQKRSISQQQQEQSEYIQKNSTPLQEYPKRKQPQNSENEFKRVESLLILDGQHITPEKNDQFSPINLHQQLRIKKGNSKQSISTVQSSITTKATGAVTTAGIEIITDEDKNIKYQTSETDNDGEIAMREYIRIRNNTQEIHEDPNRAHFNLSIYQQNKQIAFQNINTDNSQRKNRQNRPFSESKRSINQGALESVIHQQINPRYCSLNNSSDGLLETYQAQKIENTSYNFKSSTATLQNEEEKFQNNSNENEYLKSMNNYENKSYNNQHLTNNSTTNQVQMEKIIHSHFPYRITLNLFHTKQQKTSSQIFSELHEKSRINRRDQTNDLIIDSLNHSIPLASALHTKYPVFSQLLNNSPGGGKTKNQLRISQRRTALSFLNYSMHERNFLEQPSLMIESKLAS